MARNVGYGDGTIEIGEFNLDQLMFDDKGKVMNPRIGIIAKSGSGKSVVIKHIMYHFHKMGVKCGLVIAPTSKMNKYYEEFIPECFVHHEYTASIIQDWMDRQKEMIRINNERAEKGKKLTDVRAFLIMDDCMSSKHLWLKDPNILAIFNEGRHYQTCPYILSLQYAIGIQPELRSNFDFVFLLTEDTHSNRRKLHEHYAGIFRTYDLFDQVFSQVTDDYGCMVINNRLSTTDISKKIKWFRAKFPPKFMIGDKRVLKFHDENFDKEYDKKKGPVDLAGMFGKRKQIIHVNKISKAEEKKAI
jgi:hypothetical protein